MTGTDAHAIPGLQGNHDERKSLRQAGMASIATRRMAHVK